jgi:hypothetical protein
MLIRIIRTSRGSLPKQRALQAAGNGVLKQLAIVYQDTAGILAQMKEVCATVRGKISTAESATVLLLDTAQNILLTMEKR